MNILLQSRTTLFDVFGGDTVLILRTKEHLQKLGVNATISTELQPDLTGIDLVHLFNLTRPEDVLLQAVNARRQGKKIALSTLLIDYFEYERKARLGPMRSVSRLLGQSQIEYLKVLAKAVKRRQFHRGLRMYLCSGHRRAQQKLIALADVLLPNSYSEVERVKAWFPQATNKRLAVVRNAVDEKLFDSATVSVSSEVEKYRGAILCVARIEGLKNQLNLVRACNDLPWPLLLIGQPAPNHRAFYEKIKAEAGPNIKLMGSIDQTLLPQYYKVARVHCLISWMETTGLSSLEAGVMGNNIVVSTRGDVRDYFKDFAFYCEPDSVESIRQAVIKAYESPVDPGLGELIREKYTWAKAAEAYHREYQIVLGGKTADISAALPVK